MLSYNQTMKVLDMEISKSFEAKWFSAEKQIVSDTDNEIEMMEIDSDTDKDVEMKEIDNDACSEIEMMEPVWKWIIFF